MDILDLTTPVEPLTFAELEDGEVFQKEGDRRLYLKSSHSSSQGGNVVRLATGKRSTFKDDLAVVIRNDVSIAITDC
jgi:hypothetical protein